MTIGSAVAPGNYNDIEYQAFLIQFKHRFWERIKHGAEPLFTTDAEGLWEVYLGSFKDPIQTQHHNCNACREFIQRYAGLVTIDEKGFTHPALLDPWIVPESLYPAIEAMAKVVRQANVTGVFLSSFSTLGTPETGPWRHMAVELPRSTLYKGIAKTAGQMMAEKKQDYETVCRALNEFSPELVEAALQILKKALYRNEKVVGPVQWLHDLQVSRAKAAKGFKHNLIWKAVATAPAGFCHPRTSMAGTLLEDLAAGMSFEQVSRRFEEKMHPLRYQRPQAGPTAGNIAQAERLFARLQAEGSLARRFARLEEIEAIWRPKLALPPQGIFSHLQPEKSLPSSIKIPPQTMTWAKFSRLVLPEAEKIEFFTSAMVDTYTALVTAVDPEAPPILQWDSVEARNPFSWYFWHFGAKPEQFKLRYRRWHEVSAVTFKPSMWGGRKLPHQGEGVIFILKDARETRQAGAGLFPEILKAEFYSVRSVLEAYSKKAKIEDMENSTACGIALFSPSRWDHHFRVTSREQVSEYILDRWD